MKVSVVTRVDDRVERPALLVVAEDGGGELLAVERAVRGEHVVAEELHDVGEPARPWRDGLARELIGVDDGHAALHAAAPRRRSCPKRCRR